MKNVMVVGLLSFLALLTGCVSGPQVMHERAVVQDVAVAKAQSEPAKCVQSRQAEARYGIRIYTIVSFVNDTADVFYVSASGTGVMLKETPVCPNGGRFEFAVPHPLTDYMQNNVSVVWRSTVDPKEKDSFGTPKKPRIGNMVVNAGGPQGYTQVFRASSSSTVY